MKFLVLGSGLMGSALAFDLARSKNVEKVTLADADLLRAEQAAHKIGSPTVVPMNLDVTMIDSVVDAMKQHDCVISAVSYRYNSILTKAAIAARVHFCDLGGNDEVVHHQLSLDAEARKANVLIVPNCGLAPGMANVLAARGAELFESLDSVELRVGGLPQTPTGPLKYAQFFSMHGRELGRKYHRVFFKLRIDRPIFINAKGAALALAFDNQSHGNRLHASGRKAELYFVPEQWREFVSDQPIKQASRLLRMHQTQVNGARMFQGLRNGVFSDFMKGDAFGLCGIQTQNFRNMPRNRFAFTIFVCCQQNFRGVFGRGLERGDSFFAARRHFIGWGKVVLGIYSHFAFGKIAHMTKRGEHVVLPSQILGDGFCLRWRLNNDQGF